MGQSLLTAPEAPETVKRAAPRPGRATTVLGWATLAAILTAGVPLFLCSPYWFDIYHYDICARTMQRHGNR